jgi:serine/threonine protein phosphatase 1
MKDDIFVVGDIHGCAAELVHLLTRLPLTNESTVIFLGDYIDRGPASSKVVDVVLDLFSYCKVIPLMGNHEQLLLNFMREGAPDEDIMNFIYNGGNFTLGSYANNKGEYEIPHSHQQFFTSLKLFFTIGNYFFVHAGVPNLSLSQMSEENKQDLLWIRTSFFESTFAWEKLIIHGHTPVKKVEITPRRINLDTGCVYGNKLTAMGLPSFFIYDVARDVSIDRTHIIAGRRAIRHEGSLNVAITINTHEILCKSINFNEFGILIYYHPEISAEIGATIQGKIKQTDIDIPFQGEIIRKDSNNNFAIKFNNPIIAQD